MAIPLSLSLAVREAARLGIIIKNADCLERLLSIKNIVFDKTGTLTAGDLQVQNLSGGEDHEAIQAAFALEVDQPHPIARVLRQQLAPLITNSTVKAEKVRQLKIGGIEGEWNGKLWRLTPAGVDKESLNGIFGHYRLMGSGIERLSFDVADQIKPNGREAVRWAKEAGYNAYLLSGDHPSTVQMCAHQLGLSPEKAFGGFDPAKKVRFIQELPGATLMIGDGANDSGALAAANVGIAVRGAMDVSLKAADAYLVSANLASLPVLFELAQRTQATIQRNLAFSVFFNLIAGSLAIGGLMTPLWAAVLMPLSSLTVLISSLAAKSKTTPQSQTSDRPMQNPVLGAT